MRERLTPTTLSLSLAAGKMLLKALQEDPWSFSDSGSAEWSRLPIPDWPFTVGIDGSRGRAQHKQGWFEVIAGKNLLAFKRGEESQQPVSSK